MQQANLSALMMRPYQEVNLSNKRIVLILPEILLTSTDDAAHSLSMSRLAFIRQALIAKLIQFRRDEAESIKQLYSMDDGRGAFVSDGVVWFRDDG